MGDQPALDQPALDFDRQLAETVARVEDELYGVAPAEFVGRRSEAVRSAKENGDRALADAVAALRKPTAAAWTLNAFARDHEPTVEALLELGGRLRAAMERGEGDELRRLARERRGAVAAAIGEVRARATEQGRPLSMSVAGQIEQTLRAALASQTDGERLRRGVLATPLTERGENPLPSIGGTARLRIVGADAPPTDSVPTDSVPTNSVPTEAPKRRDETATKRLARAEETLRDATHALDAAADRRADLEAERERLDRRRSEIDRLLREERTRQSEAEARLRRARSELRAARSSLGRDPRREPADDR